MKLVDVECSFEGNKITFFSPRTGAWTSAGWSRTWPFSATGWGRQIGVRDEAKMLGGIGICGRPFCCSQFLDEFQPLSTKTGQRYDPCR